MRGKTALVVLATAALGALVAVPAAGKEDMGDRRDERGAVLPCSLDGVNPVHHPDIFGNPATAKSFGFEKSRDGTWHVQADCSRSQRENQKR